MDQRNNILDTIRLSFGEELSPDLIANITNMNDSLLIQFAYKIIESEKSPYIPQKEKGEIRPFLTYQILNEIARTSGLEITTDHAYSADNFSHGPMVDIVKRQLLYCHKVTLFDSLPYIADFLRSPNAQAKEKLQNYFSWLYELAPLIENDIVTFISEPGYKESGGIILNELYNMFPNTESINIEIAKELNLKPDDLLVTHMTLNTTNHLYEMAHAISRFPGKFDYYFTHKFQYKVLQRQIHNALENIYKKEIQYISPPFQLTLNIPNLDALSVEDIVNIRNNDDTFNQWRYDLSKALIFAQNNLNNIYFSENSINQNFKEHTKSLEQLLEEVSWISRLKKGTHGFVIGSVGTSMVQLLAGAIDPITTFVPPLISEFLNALFLQNKSQDHSNLNAALHHYTLFTTPSNPS